MNKISIKSLKIAEISEFLEKQGQPKFRTEQILEWLYLHQVNDFKQMTNLPKLLIEQLSRNFVIEKISAKDVQKSNDGSVKYLLELQNSNASNSKSYIEAVGIPANNSSNRLTICISSQVGCPMECSFCATGQQGFSRNLTVGEIVDQVLFVSNDFNIRASNIVVMGQGEPFLNFDNLIDALEIINNPKIVNIGARKITVSTSGIIPSIKKFANIDKQYGLAISLHSAIQEKRNSLMHGTKNYNLKSLKKALEEYISKTNRRITFEYLMIKDITDTEEDLKALKGYCNNFLCHINLIK